MVQWHAPVIQLFGAKFRNGVGLISLMGNSPSKEWVNCVITYNPAQVEEPD